MSNIEMCICGSNHNSISYQNDRDITVKTSTFLQIRGVISKTLKFSQVQKHNRMKIYDFWHYQLYNTDAKLGQLENRINPG
jgi:hypothetical protein